MNLEDDFKPTKKDKRRERYKKSKKHEANLKAKCKNKDSKEYKCYKWQEDRRLSKFVFEDREKPFLQKSYRTSHNKFYSLQKKVANRRVRHSKVLLNKGLSKKAYDYQGITSSD